jgi:cellulose synthase/poly-beta-1,6-N-acetylglucosamine synthase-like glycosyltransferase
MSIFMSLTMAALALILLVPTLVFFIEVVIGCLVPKHDVEKTDGRKDGRVAVLIPAHNEGAGITPTIEDIKQQLCPGDRIVVVADNCSDDTAAVAASLGAEVCARNDPTRIGKGYALDWGVDHLTGDPPAIVIVIDADCRITAGTIDRLAAACAQSQRPVQSLYLMTAPAGAAINHQVAEFAWRVKNWVRPLGLGAMALPCQLMGTGMAFPWHVIRSADLSSGFIVEDLKLGLELAAAGHPPLFCPSAVVTSTFPTSVQGTETQRQRWEQGHIGLILTKSPVLLFSALRGRSKGLLALTLDLIVPPLTLLALLLTAMVFLASIATLANVSLYPLAISLFSFCLLVASVFAAWIKYGRDILPPSSFALIGRYCLGKLNLYRAVLLGFRNSRWIRTDRG